MSHMRQLVWYPWNGRTIGWRRFKLSPSNLFVLASVIAVSCVSFSVPVEEHFGANKHDKNPDSSA